MQTAYVRTGGHLQVQHRDYFLYGNGNPTAYGISNYESLLSAIREDPTLKPMLIVATPTSQFLGIAGNYEEGVSRTVVGVGFVASDIERMRQWNEYQIRLGPPHFLLNGAPVDAAVVGTGVARVLLLCEQLGVKDCSRPESRSQRSGIALPSDVAGLAEVADTVNGAIKSQPKTARLELLASTGRGSPNVASISVLAAEAQGFKEVDDVLVVLQLAEAQQLVYGRAPPRATSIMVQLASTTQMSAAASRLREIVSSAAPTQPLAILDFEKLNPFYVQSIQLFDTIFGFIFALISSIVLFTVSNTMTASVVERTVEIGTLRAVGLRRTGIRQLFVKEGFLLGCVGAGLGIASAFILAFAANQAELTWLPPGSSEPLPLSIRVWGETKIIALTFIGLVGIATVSAWFPAYRASKLQIVDALRHA
jgi:putative ABC transport system permease protein